MLKIEKLIQESTLSSEIKKELLTSIDKIKSNQTIDAPDILITNIAKNFASQNSQLIESSGIIPEILMQKNFKIIDFLINTKVIGVYCILGFIIFLGWMGPVFATQGVVFRGRELYWKDYYFFLIIPAQLVYYRFLWKKLMP